MHLQLPQNIKKSGKIFMTVGSEIESRGQRLPLKDERISESTSAEKTQKIAVLHYASPWINSTVGTKKKGEKKH